MRMKKILSTILSAALALSVFSCAAMAEGETAGYGNGTYTATAHMHNGSNPANYSMCDSIFAHTADVTVTDSATQVTIYVAYPVPAFSTQGTDGTIKDVVATYNDQTYTAELDITTKPTKTFDTAGTLFGINAGDVLPTEAVTFTLPRDAVNALSDGISVSAYVNVVMNTTASFVLKATDLTSTGSTETTEDKSMQITGTVEEKPTEYTVTIPESIDLGTLSDTTDNAKTYDVVVTASNLRGGSVTVTGEASGTLASGENKLTFSNAFSTASVTEDTAGTTFTGTIGVTAANVAAAAAGNYTGTTNFTISFAAGA